MFCGKFIPKKRPLDLVKAARLLTNTRSALHLLFVGSGELGAELRAHCNVVYDAENHVAPDNQGQLLDNGKPFASFVGFQNQSALPAYYSAADVLVLPSDGRETWGLVVNEGMACGLPAVVSDAVGCAPDMIEEAQTGFTFPFGNVEALAEAIQRLVKQKRCGFDFASRLREKLADHSVKSAAQGTINAAETLAMQRVVGTS